MRIFGKIGLAIGIIVAVGACSSGPAEPPAVASPPVLSADDLFDESREEYDTPVVLETAPSREHLHAEGHEVPEGMSAPTVQLSAAPSSGGGWDLYVQVTDFRFAPEQASAEHIDGEGHMHIYVDGEKIGRVFGSAHHIAGLASGEHAIRVELSSNDHSPITVNGHFIEDTVIVTAEAAAGTTESAAGQREAPDEVSLTVEAVGDPAAGWVIHAVAGGFRVGSPQHDTDGYVRLTVGGHMDVRMYEAWRHVDAGLTTGNHEVRVELRHHDGAPVTLGGVPVMASTRLLVPGE